MRNRYTITRCSSIKSSKGGSPLRAIDLFNDAIARARETRGRSGGASGEKGRAGVDGGRLGHGGSGASSRRRRRRTGPVRLRISGARVASAVATDHRGCGTQITAELDAVALAGHALEATLAVD